MTVLEKIAATAAQRVEAFHATDSKDWTTFEKGLKSKAFNKAVQLHPASDDKLRRYTDQNHKYLKSKRVADEVASASSKQKKYEIKVLPGGGLGCGCKDWQYKRSHSGQDCKHIKEYKAKSHQPRTINPMEKRSSITGGIALARAFEKSKHENAKARQMNAALAQLKAARR